MISPRSLCRLAAALLLAAIGLPGFDAHGAEAPDTVAGARPGLVKRIIRYFEQTNNPRARRAFDWSIVGGPFYSSDTRLGIGLVAAGQYYNSLADTARCQPSTVALKAQLSTTLFYELGFEGVNLFAGDRTRVSYDVKFLSLPTYNWGVGWTRDTDDAYKTKYKKLELQARIEAKQRLTGHLFAGLAADFYYTHATDIREPDRWQCSPLTATDFGLGALVEFDSRDVITDPHRGYYLTAVQRFFPRFLGNGSHSFSSTTLDLRGYWPAWRGATVAARLRGVFTYGHTPWMRMPTIGGAHCMRGYYEGQYIDRRMAEATVELRQRVYKRSGVALWAGAANLWGDSRSFTLRHTLPNVGVGYRFEFKQRVNIRLDLGVGRHTWGIEFNINEAF